MQENDSEFITFMTMAEFSQLVEAVPEAWAIAAKAYEVSIPQMREMVESKKILIMKFMIMFVKQLAVEYPTPINMTARMTSLLSKSEAEDI